MDFSLRLSFIFLGLLVPATLNPGPLWSDGMGPAGGLHRELAAMAGRRDAAMVAAPDGKILSAVHPDLALVPASILKLLTTLAALEKLGPDYRFKTEFFLGPQDDLIIKGYGDPLLISENLQAIAVDLASRLTAVRGLVMDDSYFEQPVRIPGRGTSSEPYDAPNGALCVNFNTVAFNRRNGSWVSDEPQTPLLPSVIPKIIASGLPRGRITMAADDDAALQYSGELFRFFLQQAGMKIQGGIRRGRVDQENDQRVWSYRSRNDLQEVTSDLLEYSNNFIANQILLVMGAQVLGPPATMDKGLRVLRNYYRDELKIDDGRIVEGSGISRRNRVTARTMMKILGRYEPFHTLMRRDGRQFYKTGHLNGIRTRAGFLAGADGGLYRFVVIINTPGKTTDGIMKTIEKYLK
jgi:D-alanyl-D-alanine carboxypeptidase/D-alanyl-D-alanine-endopeptidase (penicillin-binding protein 4)